MTLYVVISSSKLIETCCSNKIQNNQSQPMIHEEHLSKEFQEFLLSFNTTICFGIALLMFILMRQHTNIIKEETINNIADTTIKFMPSFVINLLDKFHHSEETHECLSPV